MFELNYDMTRDNDTMSLAEQATWRGEQVYLGGWVCTPKGNLLECVLNLGQTDVRDMVVKASNISSFAKWWREGDRLVTPAGWVDFP